MPKKSETPFLHIYPQLDNHIEAWVVGNLAGLKALKKAITKALQKKRLTGSESLAGDGEGYQVLVLPLADDQFSQTPLPYTDSVVPDKTGIHPYRLVSREDYRRVMVPKSVRKKLPP